MHVWLVGLLFALESAAPAVVPQPAVCPTAPQIDAELQRMGESATVDRLGASEVSVVGDVMRIVLRDGMGGTLGIREVAAPPECAKRVSVAAVLLAAWAKSWTETALAPEARPEPRAPRPARAAELGIAAGGSADGDARAMAAGLLAGLQIHEALALAMAADVTGQRQLGLGPGAATYQVSRLGLGVALRAQPGLSWMDVALLPQITRLSVDGKNLTTPRASAVWGASVEVRGRIGVRWRALAPFFSVAVNRALIRETLTLDDTTDRARLSSWDIGVLVGVSWLFHP